MRYALLLLVIATSAEAGKPPSTKPLTKAQQAAVQLATDWIAKPTGKPVIAIYGEDGKLACDAMTCIDKLAAKGQPHLWRRNLGGPLAAAKFKILDDKAAIIIELDEGCDGTESQTLVVTKTKKVIAVFSQLTACSE